MVVDSETFTDMAVHLKLVSDAILKTARHLAAISADDKTDRPDLAEHWAETLDGLMGINSEITVVEKLFRAILEANREENSSQKDQTQ